MLVHPALSPHSLVPNYFPQLKDRSFDMSHDGKTHELLTSFISTADLSKKFLCAMGTASEFDESRLERKLKLGYACTHGGLVDIVLRNTINQSKMILAEDYSGMLMQPLESFIIMHKAHREIFDYLITRLGCQPTDSWRVYNCVTSTFAKQLLEHRIYDTETEISKKLNNAIKYSGFLADQFGNKKLSDEVLSALSRLSVLEDFHINPALRKLAFAHIAQTEEILCGIFTRQLEILSPAKPSHIHFYSKAPDTLEAVYLKPEYFIDNKAAANYGINVSKKPDFLRFLDSSRALFSRQIEKELPHISPHIAIYCIQNAGDSACFIAGAKKFANYSIRAASLAMSAGRFAATWIP